MASCSVEPTLVCHIMDLTQKHQDPIGQLEAQYFALRDFVEPLADRQKRSELDQSHTAEKYQKTLSHLVRYAYVSRCVVKNIDF